MLTGRLSASFLITSSAVFHKVLRLVCKSLKTTPKSSKALTSGFKKFSSQFLVTMSSADFISFSAASISNLLTSFTSSPILVTRSSFTLGDIFTSSNPDSF